MSVTATATPVANFTITLSLGLKEARELRERYPGHELDEATEFCVRESLAGEGFVRISRKVLIELAGLCGVEVIGSEGQLVAAVQKRLGASKGTVSFTLDPTMFPVVQEVADANAISLSEALKRYFEQAWADGLFQQYTDVRGLFWRPKEWERLKAAMKGRMVTAEGIITR